MEPEPAGRRQRQRRWADPRRHRLGKTRPPPEAAENQGLKWVEPGKEKNASLTPGPQHPFMRRPGRRLRHPSGGPQCVRTSPRPGPNPHEPRGLYGGERSFLLFLFRITYWSFNEKSPCVTNNTLKNLFSRSTENCHDSYLIRIVHNKAFFFILRLWKVTAGGRGQDLTRYRCAWGWNGCWDTRQSSLKSKKCKSKHWATFNSCGIY